MLQIELIVDGLLAGHHLLEEDGSLEIRGFPVGADRYRQFVFMDVATLRGTSSFRLMAPI